jgi:starch synthase
MPSLKEKDLELYKEGTNTAMQRGGASYADAITFGADKIDKKLTEEFTKVRERKPCHITLRGDLTDYLQLYSDLAGK